MIERFITLLSYTVSSTRSWTWNSQATDVTNQVCGVGVREEEGNTTSGGPTSHHKHTVEWSATFPITPTWGFWPRYAPTTHALPSSQALPVPQSPHPPTTVLPPTQPSSPSQPHPPPQKQYPLSKTENVLFPGGFRSGTQFPTAKLQNFSSNLFFLLSWLALALPELAVRANWCKMSRVMNLQGGGRGGVGEGDCSTHSMVGPGKRKPRRRKEGIC